MTGLPKTLHAALALVALSAALAGALWHGYVEADATEAGTAAEAVADAAFLPGEARAVGAAPLDAEAAAALARPLFNPRRRPDIGGTQQAAERLPRLTGVLTALDERIALFEGPAGGKPQAVREGGTIAGHVVRSIRPGEAILAGPRGQHVLHPGFARNGNTTRP